MSRIRYLDEAQAYIFLKLLYGVISTEGSYWNGCQFLGGGGGLTKQRTEIVTH